MDWWEKGLGIILVCEDRNCGGFNPFRILLTSGGGFLFHNVVLSATYMIIRIIHRNGCVGYLAHPFHKIDSLVIKERETWGGALKGLI